MICLEAVNARLGSKLIETEHNTLAVAYLKAAQESLKMNNRAFAATLGEELGLVVSESTYSYIVSGRTRRQPVPAAFLVAAARLSGLPLLDEQRERKLGERLERLESWMNRVEGLLRQLLPPRETGPHFVASPELQGGG